MATGLTKSNESAACDDDGVDTASNNGSVNGNRVRYNPEGVAERSDATGQSSRSNPAHCPHLQMCAFLT
jgi:hypothetical protein